MDIVYLMEARLPTERAYGYAVMKMCEQFAALGHSVTLIGPRKQSPLHDNPFEYYGIEKNFEYTQVPAFDFLSKATRIGSVAYWLDLVSFIFSFSVSKGSLIRNADVLYTRNYHIALFLSGHKTVLELHDLPSRNTLFTRVAKRMKTIITISHGLRDEIMEMIPSIRASVAPDAVDLKRFKSLPEKSDARAALGLPVGKHVALYAGHFYPWKGVTTLADAAQELDKETLTVLVGGVDPDLADVKKRSANSTQVRIFPFQEPSALNNFFASADLLILPNSAMNSIASVYTSPLKLFEYMATGKPIVASNVSSLREVLNEGNAFFFKPDDPADLARVIRYVLTHPEEGQKRAARALTDVQEYTWENRARYILENL